MSRSDGAGDAKGRMLQDPRSVLQVAEEHRRSGRLKEAIVVCLDGLSRHPNLDAVRVTLGRAYLESDRAAEARDELQSVFERHPDHHLAGKLLAEARKRIGDLEGAAAACREILRHYPRDREVEAILASIALPPADAAKPEAKPAAPGAPGGAFDPAPDYLPEDVASAAPGPGRPSGSTGAPAPPPADALQTNTLADLYLRQGLFNRALEVYRGMLRLDPQNDPLRRRIEEIERRGAAAFPAPAAPPTVPMPAQAALGSPPGETGPAGRPPGRSEGQRAAIGRLERWLHAVRSAPEDAGKAGAPR